MLLCQFGADSDFLGFILYENIAVADIYTALYILSGFNLSKRWGQSTWDKVWAIKKYRKKIFIKRNLHYFWINGDELFPAHEQNDGHDINKGVMKYTFTQSTQMSSFVVIFFYLDLILVIW